MRQHPGNWSKFKMAELENGDCSVDVNSDNIFEIMQKQSNGKYVSKQQDGEFILRDPNDVSLVSLSKRSEKCFRNLPGLHMPKESHVNGVVKEATDKSNTPSPTAYQPEGKRLKLSPMSAPVQGTFGDAVTNADCAKRRRIQHDYRRLSSSGYIVDDSKERRYSSTSDSEQSLSPSSPKGKPKTSTPVVSPPQKVKPLKIKLSKPDSLDPLGGSTNGKLIFENTYILIILEDSL